jgi:hypothetical protein
VNEGRPSGRDRSCVKTAREKTAVVDRVCRAVGCRRRVEAFDRIAASHRMELKRIRCH